MKDVVHGADGDAAAVGDGPDGELLVVHHGPQVQGEPLGARYEWVIGAGVRPVVRVRDCPLRRLSSLGHARTLRTLRC